MKAEVVHEIEWKKYWERRAVWNRYQKIVMGLTAVRKEALAALPNLSPLEAACFVLDLDPTTASGALSTDQHPLPEIGSARAEILAHRLELTAFTPLQKLINYFERCESVSAVDGVRLVAASYPFTREQLIDSEQVDSDWWNEPIELKEPKKKTDLYGAIWHEYSAILKENGTPTPFAIRTAVQQDKWGLSTQQTGRSKVGEALKRLSKTEE